MNAAKQPQKEPEYHMAGDRLSRMSEASLRINESLALCAAMHHLRGDGVNRFPNRLGASES